MDLRHSILALVAFSFSITAANAAVWDIDSKHSSATFKIRHMMISDVRGQIGGIKGTVNYDGKNVDDIKVNAQLDPSTIDTGDDNRDAHLKNADFFDVAKYPTMTFESTGVVPILRGGFKLGGKLTMHGVTRPVELSVDGPTEPIKDAKGATKIGAVGTTTIKRKDFGLTYNSTLDNGGVALGEDVQITLDLELVRRDGASDGAAPANDAKTPPATTDKKAKKEKKEKPVKEKAVKEKPVKEKKESKKTKTETKTDTATTNK